MKKSLPANLESDSGKAPASSSALTLQREAPEWMPGEGTKHDLVAAAITGEILQKKLPVGSLLPSERKLAKALGVSYMTARAGVTRLVDEGFIERRQGQGAYLIKAIQPKTIAAIHLDIYDPRITYLFNLLPAFERVITAQALKMEVVAIDSGAQGGSAHAEIIRRWQRGQLKGLLIVSRYPARQILDLMASGIPFVWISDSLGKEPMYSVKIDYDAAFFASVPRLKRKRAGALHIVAGRSFREWGRSLKTLALSGLWEEKRLHHHYYNDLADLNASVGTLFDEIAPESSIYILGEAFYQVFMKEAERRGIKVPEQMTVVVEYIASPAASFTVPPTGWELPFEGVAERALVMLEKAAENRPTSPVIEYVMPIFRLGASTPQKV